MVWQTIPDLNIFKCILLSFLMWFFFPFFLLTLINQPNPYFISHRQSLSDSVRWWLQYIRSCLHFLVALILSFFLLCSYHKYSPHSSQSYAGFFNPWLSFFIFLFFYSSWFLLIPVFVSWSFFLCDPFYPTLIGVLPIFTLPQSMPSSKTLYTPTLYITLAMPVCPRSVSCHPMGSMSFKALQAQPLPHCRSQERNLSRDAASSSLNTPRRRTTGTTQVDFISPWQNIWEIIFVNKKQLRLLLDGKDHLRRLHWLSVS